MSKINIFVIQKYNNKPNKINFYLEMTKAEIISKISERTGVEKTIASSSCRVVNVRNQRINKTK